MRPIVVVAALLVFFAASGLARAGGVTPVQYAYGGGSNGSAVIASHSPAASPSPSATSSRSAAGGAGTVGSAGRSVGGGRAGGGGKQPTVTQPLVALAGSPATPAASFGAFDSTIPVDALWALGLAVACALAAWAVRRSPGSG